MQKSPPETGTPLMHLPQANPYLLPLTACALKAPRVAMIPSAAPKSVGVDFAREATRSSMAEALPPSVKPVLEMQTASRCFATGDAVRNRLEL
jgi:hypothetical protein